MSRDHRHLNLSVVTVFGAAVFTVGFILTAVLLPTYLEGAMSPLLFALPVSVTIAGGILFVITDSDLERIQKRIHRKRPDSA